jgi:hypothetical protein
MNASATITAMRARNSSADFLMFPPRLEPEDLSQKIWTQVIARRERAVIVFRDIPQNATPFA